MCIKLYCHCSLMTSVYYSPQLEVACRASPELYWVACAGFRSPCWLGECLLVFRKDLYLVITQKLIILKSGGFRADFMRISWNPPENLINQITQQKLFKFHGVQWEGYVSGFHEIRRISKDQLPRHGKAYVFGLGYRYFMQEDQVGVFGYLCSFDILKRTFITFRYEI